MSSDPNSESSDLDDDIVLYEAESILGKKILKGKTYYFIKWADWPSQFNSWECIETLGNIQKMIDAFERGDIYDESKNNRITIESIKDLIRLTDNDDSYGHFKYGDVPKEITKMHSEFQQE